MREPELRIRYCEGFSICNENGRRGEGGGMNKLTEPVLSGAKLVKEMVR